MFKAWQKMTCDTTQATVMPAYKELLKTVEINDFGRKEGDRIAAEILQNKERYEDLGKATGIPWPFIAALHHLECSGDFRQHLANGDPISRATVNVPVGIPPGRWEDCAIAALKLKKWVNNSELDWSELHCLWRAEHWNGWGYWCYRDKMPSPYLWSGTNHYIKGKYVSDGRWDSEAKSQQCGVYAIWKALDRAGKPTATNQSPRLVAVVATITSNAMKISISTPTWGKKSTKQAASLPEDQRAYLTEGKLDVVELLPVRDRHYHVKLATPVNGLQEMFIWSDHASIIKSGEDIAAIGVVTKKTSEYQFDQALRIYMQDVLKWDLEHHEHCERKGEYLVQFGIEDFSCSQYAPIPNNFYQDEFNDRLILAKWIPATGTWAIVQNCAATTEPGLHYTENPMNPNGAARLKLGVQWEAWGFGRHGSRSPYEALVQKANLDFYRDSNKDGSRAGDTLSHGDDNCINIHHGWNSDKISVHSAGCQVRRFMADHEEMMRYMKRYLPPKGGLYKYGIVDGDAFYKWWKG